MDPERFDRLARWTATHSRRWLLGLGLGLGLLGAGDLPQDEAAGKDRGKKHPQKKPKPCKPPCGDGACRKGRCDCRGRDKFGERLYPCGKTCCSASWGCIDNACCFAPCDGRCCGDGEQCTESPWEAVCCPTKRRCYRCQGEDCGYSCCAPGEVCVHTVGRDDDVCCRPEQVCGDSECCGGGESCCDDGHCRPADQRCNNGTCCQNGVCCGNHCCLSSQVCCGGTECCDGHCAGSTCCRRLGETCGGDGDCCGDAKCKSGTCRFCPTTSLCCEQPITVRGEQCCPTGSGNSYFCSVSQTRSYKCTYFLSGTGPGGCDVWCISGHEGGLCGPNVQGFPSPGSNPPQFCCCTVQGACSYP